MPLQKHSDLRRAQPSRFLRPHTSLGRILFVNATPVHLLCRLRPPTSSYEPYASCFLCACRKILCPNAIPYLFIDLYPHSRAIIHTTDNVLILPTLPRPSYSSFSIAITVSQSLFLACYTPHLSLVYSPSFRHAPYPLLFVLL